jgi:colanic acid/amylovoran biosynthesis protein
MRVLVLWADDSSPNLGVRTLGRGTAQLVRGVWPHAEVEFHNYGHRARYLPHGRIRSLLRERVAGRSGMQRWLGGFDLVLDTRSGDSFSDIYGLHRLSVMSLVAEFASQAGVPVVLGPQTIGPFRTRRGAVMASRSLRRAALVIARDPDSVAEADRLGGKALRSTDVVFALPVPAVAKSRDVVLNVSGLLWVPNDHVDANAYRGTITRLLQRLQADGRRVTLLAHVLDSPNPDNDVAAIREVAHAAPDAEVIVPTGVDEVREVVASAAVVVGSRMHACLNALSVGTPAVPLAYSRKFEPLFTDLGWSHTIDLRTGGDTADRVMREIGGVGDRLATAAVVDRARSRLTHASAALASVVA